jgi:hypothetical protein
VNVPTTAYRPIVPSAVVAAPYIPWLIDRAVRAGRDNGYGNIVDQALTMILRDLGVTAPAGGFVDSDGRNAQGRLNDGFGADGYNADGFNRQGYNKDGFNADGYNADGDTREGAVDVMVDGWDNETAAAVLVALAGRVA